MAVHDPTLETFLAGTKLVNSGSADWQLTGSIANSLFPDQASAKAVAYLLANNNNTKFIQQGTFVFDYASNKDLSPEQRRMDELMLSRGIEEYLVNLAAFKALLPASTDSDDSVAYANLRYLVDQTVVDANAVKALLPAACPL